MLILVRIQKKPLSRLHLSTPQARFTQYETQPRSRGAFAIYSTNLIAIIQEVEMLSSI